MGNSGIFSAFYALLFLASLVTKCHSDERKLHIVYLGDRPRGDVFVEAIHESMLRTVLASGSSSVKDSLVYSYGRSFNGFAAKLTEEEAAMVANMKGVVSVSPSRTLKLHTTRSWDFMGFFDKGQNRTVQEGDVIIGFLDTGVWPEHPSFHDTGYGPPPAKWKGTCQTQNFTCNNKIIGARYYKNDNNFSSSDIPSARDTEGHGTHTASTAAGIVLPGTCYFGLAEGLARGGVPKARIAVYKVCWSTDCSDADILKAFDDAIADGVDIISVSLGSELLLDYFEDPIAIGSFHAMKNGILTSASAGNFGPNPVSVANYAPWTMTVAASSIDRKFVANLALGNGQILTGITINTFDLNGTTYPLIWGGDAANYSSGFNQDESQFCGEGTMNLDKVAGKIVFCETELDGSSVLNTKGVGIVMTQYDINSDYAFSFPLPATVINPDDADKVWEYIKSTEYPVATILVGETWKDAMAPKVVSFSSRGPNPISSDILKPDITAPGVDILAGWSPMAPPSVYDGDMRSVLFNIISGTSMACPHASATAAYVKAAHPDWSPAAIKSAIMTTAYAMNPRNQEDREFSYGSGHINPTAAIDPGLIFNASETDFINLLCKQGYNTTTLRLVTGDNSICANTTIGRALDFNYPSFALYILDGQQIEGTFTRTVTNVGPANSTYTAIVFTPSLFNISVKPSVLKFSSIGEMQSFTVKVTGPAIYQHPVMSGSITWSDGERSVRTPVVVHNYYPGAPYTVFELDSNISSENMNNLDRRAKDRRRRLSGGSRYSDF